MGGTIKSCKQSLRAEEVEEYSIDCTTQTIERWGCTVEYEDRLHESRVATPSQAGATGGQKGKDGRLKDQIKLIYVVVAVLVHARETIPTSAPPPNQPFGGGIVCG